MKKENMISFIIGITLLSIGIGLPISMLIFQDFWLQFEGTHDIFWAWLTLLSPLLWIPTSIIFLAIGLENKKGKFLSIR